MFNEIFDNRLFEIKNKVEDEKKFIQLLFSLNYIM